MDKNHPLELLFIPLQSQIIWIMPFILIFLSKHLSINSPKASFNLQYLSAEICRLFLALVLLVHGRLQQEIDLEKDSRLKQQSKGTMAASTEEPWYVSETMTCIPLQSLYSCHPNIHLYKDLKWVKKSFDPIPRCGKAIAKSLWTSHEPKRTG